MIILMLGWQNIVRVDNDPLLRGVLAHAAIMPAAVITTARLKQIFEIFIVVFRVEIEKKSRRLCAREKPFGAYYSDGDEQI